MFACSGYMFHEIGVDIAVFKAFILDSGWMKMDVSQKRTMQQAVHML